MIEPTAPALIATLAGNAWTIPGERLRAVALPGALAPLPFSPLPVEGLATINARPVVQLNGAAVLGLNNTPPSATTTGRLVVLSLGNNDEIALRVDALAPGSDSGSGLPPLFPLTELERWFPDRENGSAFADSAPPEVAAITVLPLTCGGQRLLVRLEGLSRVAEVGSLETLALPGGDVLSVAETEGRLLPAISLAQRLNLAEGTKSWAVIGDGPNGPVALLVENVSRLERLNPARLTALPRPDGNTQLCHVAATGQISAVHSFAALIDTASLQPNSTTDTSPLTVLAADALNETMLGLEAGGVLCRVPLELVRRVLALGELPAAAFLRQPRSRTRTLLPVINAEALRGALPPPQAGEGRGGGNCAAVVLGTPNCPALVLVTGRTRVIATDETHSAPLFTPALPWPASALFRGLRATFSPTHPLHGDLPPPLAGEGGGGGNGWIPELRSDLTFTTLPWPVKRAIARARLGWADGSLLGTPSPSPLAPFPLVRTP
ncbi:hypothetical protein WCLP8_4520004 [uncultured Gammaproteobacteria bacterium]